jgi:arsenate reductase-like glutaredoxin family protein
VNQTIIGRHLLAAMVAADRSCRPYPRLVASPPVQVFGTADSQPTRAALRFFKERRIEVHLVDLRRKPMASGELRRFVERLGAAALADTDGRAWRDAGLGFMRMDDAELVERLLADQALLRLPLVRVGNGVAAGRDEAAWKRLLAASSQG